MNLVSDLGLPPSDYTAADFPADPCTGNSPGLGQVNPNHGPVPYVA